MYGKGASEELLGRWRVTRPSDVTDRAVPLTKGRYGTGPDVNNVGNSRRHLHRSLDTSLRRLEVETIDLYQLHGWAPLTPVEETIAFLDAAIRSGKIHYVGLSNFNPTGLLELQAAVLLAPAIISLLRDLCLPVRYPQNLTLRRLNLDLAELYRHLLRTHLLPSHHMQLLRSLLILSITQVQSQPVGSLPTPYSTRRRVISNRDERACRLNLTRFLRVASS